MRSKDQLQLLLHAPSHKTVRVRVLVKAITFVSSVFKTLVNDTDYNVSRLSVNIGAKSPVLWGLLAARLSQPSSEIPCG